jgi:hypothetical protein
MGEGLRAVGYKPLVASADPTYFRDRGVWFNGESTFLGLPSLVLNHTFSVQLWIRAIDNGNLFSISRNASS